MIATRYLPFVGRLMIGLPFSMSGLGKLVTYGATTGMISAVGLPFPPLAFAIAVAVELGGGLLLVAGYHARSVAITLAVFLASDGAFVPQQFRRPEPNDPLPQKRDDGRRAPPDRGLRSRRIKHRQPPERQRTEIKSRCGGMKRHGCVCPSGVIRLSSAEQSGNGGHRRSESCRSESLAPAT